MGGRKTYSVRSVVGSDKNLIPKRRRLASALGEENPKKIVQTTVDLFRNSDTGVSNLSTAIDMFGYFKEKREAKDPAQIKKDVSAFWTKTKEDKNIKTSSEIDRIIVDSAVKVLRRRGK